MYSDGLIYQDSRMATEEEFLKDLSPFFMKEQNENAKGGPVLFGKDDVVYTDSGESHSLIIGDTGSMKTLRFVLPLIYSCGRAGESMVIVDPKGELSKKTGTFLKEMGYKTPIINLRKPQDSPSRWNPMEKIQDSYDGWDEERENAVLQLNDLLNNMFFSRSSADKDRYWNESAGQLALGICQLMESLGEKLSVKNLLKWRYENIPNGMLKTYFESIPTDSAPGRRP